MLLKIYYAIYYAVQLIYYAKSHIIFIEEILYAIERKRTTRVQKNYE